MTTLYRNARIFTATEPAWAHALVVDGEVLSFVGDEEGARAIAGDVAEVVDLGGALVVPGFVDAHSHLLMLGEALGQVALTDARDVVTIQNRLREAREGAPNAPRLLGRGWLFDSIPDGRPTAALIDAVVADVPVYLNANDYHSCWVNTAALAELGIDRDTPDPIGGRVGRDANGDADGMLYETAAAQMVWPLLSAVQTDADHDAALDRALDGYLAAGVTAAVDMAFNEDGLAAFDRAVGRREDGVPFTALGHWFIENTGDDARNIAQVERAIELSRRPEHGGVRVIGIKLVLDGVIDACTAAMNQPYTDGTNAEPIWPLEQAKAVVAAADAAGLQVALHAIGDAASDLALDAIEHAVAVNGDRPRRHRIEHLEYTSPETPARMARLGVTASMQPVHADPAIWDNWAAMVGPERADRGLAWPEFVDAGVRLAFSTDAPTAPYPALPNMYVASTRRSALDASFPPNHPEFARPLAEAIVRGTREAAASCLEEDRRGSLAAGRQADFVVIDRDPFVLGEEALLDAQVTLTVVAGRTVHRA